MTASEAGSAVDPEHLAVGPERRVREPVDRRRGRAGAGVEHDALARLEGLAVHLDGPGTGEPAVAADEP